MSDEIAVVEKSQTRMNKKEEEICEANIFSWQIASLILDSREPLNNI